MGTITLFVTYVVSAIIRILELLMFVRAVLSWFPNLQGHPVTSFVYFMTEPVLGPIRGLLMKIPALRSIPIDFSIIAAFLLFELLESLMYGML